MVPQKTRRTVLFGIGSAIAGGVGVTAFSQPTEAASVDIDSLNVPTKTEQVSNSVQTVELTVSGSIEYQTSVIPDYVTLRLEVKRNGDHTQIDAQKIQSGLDKTYSSDYTLSGSLLDLPTIDHDDINPINVGDTKELNLTARVSMTVFNGGREINYKEATDSFGVELEKTTATVNSTISGSGTINVVTD